MGVEIKGMDRLARKVGKLSAATREGTKKAIYEIAQDVRGEAESNVQSSVKYASGELSGSIKDEIVKDSSDMITARVFSDKRQAIFRELGTGPNGEKSKKELPTGITPVYTQQAWFFPVESALQDLTVLYGIPKIRIKGKMFYRTSGQPARPFLYPALLSVESRAEEIYKRNIANELRKVAKK